MFGTPEQPPGKVNVTGFEAVLVPAAFVALTLNVYVPAGMALKVKLSVKRGEEELEIEAMLGPTDEMDAQINRHEFQNQLGGELSRRRAGFPSVFQHDTVLQPNECGGPVVDLDGRAVGINIARAGRVASYAIPAAMVKEVLATLLDAKSVSLDEGEKTH